MILIGLDPGTTTGIGRYSPIGNALLDLGSMQLHQAMEYILRTEQPRLVVFEDARHHRVHQGADNRSQRLQGVGSIKRDCAIWHEFLTDKRIPYVTRRPSSKRTKMPAYQFNLITGWKGKTNNHARDATMLVYGVNMAVAQAWMAEAQQRLSLRAA